MSDTNQNSCLTCPSMIKAEESVQFLKKSIGAPVCARYGHVIGKPGITENQQRKLADTLGSKCRSHGDARPTHQMSFRLGVTFPDPETLGQTANMPELVSSCSQCANFIRSDVVSDELGWTVDLCAAKGRLLLPTRHGLEAKSCDLRSFGKPRRNVNGMKLLPEFEDAFYQLYDPVRAFFKAKDADFVDPKDYETDKPVSDEDIQAGVRAWRQVEDKDTGNKVFLPIYSASKFTEEQAANIPQTGDDEHPEDYVDHNQAIFTVAVSWRELDETPALWGPAGVGKTEFFRHMAWLMQLPFIRISITASTELDDLAGKMHFSKEKGTYFIQGRLPRAWASPAVICLDEPNVGQPDVWQFIRPLTDNSKQLVLDMNNGEKIKRHDDAYLGMAMNPAWDVKNVGAEELGDADGSRLLHINMTLPPPELEREIIRKRIEHDGWEIDNSRLDTLAGIAEDVRRICDDGLLPITWGVRDQIKVARALRWFDLITSYRRGRADALEPEARQALLDVVKAHAPSG